MRNLLIIGGCHVVDDVFSNKIKDHYKYNKVKKIYTHITQENFSKSMALLARQNDYLQSNNYDIYFQFGNLLFHNSISHIVPAKIEKILLKRINSNLTPSLTSGSSQNKKYKILSLNFVRKILKVIILPFNFFYIPIKAFTAFNRIKRIIILNEYKRSKIIFFTPFDSPNYLDKYFRNIGKKIIYYVFSDIKNIQIIDLSLMKYDKKYFQTGDIYHLNKHGMDLLSNFCIDKIN
jgi:hypothetical protein